MIKTIISKLLYFLLCSILSLIIFGYSLFVFVANTLNHNLNLIIYCLSMFLLLVGFWVLLFIKAKVIKKISIFCVLIIFFLFSFFSPSSIYANKTNLCLDSGICSEGLETKNYDGELFLINKDSCLKYGYEWIVDEKACNLRGKKQIN